MSRSVLRWLLLAVTVAGLAIDAYVHLDLASTYDANATTTLSQGDLFRAEAIVAVLAGVVLIARYRWWSATLAALVAGGGAVLVVLYRYLDIGAFGPIPSMYEPVWYGEKTLSVLAEAVAAITAAALAVLALRLEPRRPRPTPAGR